MLTALSQKDVAVSVKFLWTIPDVEKTPVVHTVFRSTPTRHLRESYEPKDNFAYDENTAFRLLVHERRSRQHYAVDDLMAAYTQGEYNNLNWRWISFYSSTAVLPIPSSENASRSLLGFICADSREARLNDPKHLGLLEISARHLYDSLWSYVERRAISDLGAVPEFGWTVDDTLSPKCETGQTFFQETIRQLEHFYKYDSRLNGGVSNASPFKTREIPPDEGSIMDEEEERFLEQIAESEDSPASRAWLAARRQTEPTEEQTFEILTKMASYNPTARELLAKRNAH